MPAGVSRCCTNLFEAESTEVGHRESTPDSQKPPRRVNAQFSHGRRQCSTIRHNQIGTCKLRGVSMADESVGSQSVGLSDTERLHQLGYAQELKRGMSGFSIFAVSFTIISILSGCLPLFSFGMNTGGPMTMIWGWLLVGA